MLIRLVGMVLFWLLGALTVFFVATAVDGWWMHTSASYSSAAPFLLGLASLSGIPCIFIWRFMIR